jgi:protein-L-isoaspartate O-methyltransferase
MVESQLRVTKVTDDRVIMAFENVPREEFVSPELNGLA